VTLIMRVGVEINHVAAHDVTDFPDTPARLGVERGGAGFGPSISLLISTTSS
jgi:hypothetical protein